MIEITGEQTFVGFVLFLAAMIVYRLLDQAYKGNL